MIAKIEHKPFSLEHKVLLDGEEVASYKTRTSALKLVNKLLQADFIRMDLHNEGRARLWKEFSR